MNPQFSSGGLLLALQLFLIVIPASGQVASIVDDFLCYNNGWFSTEWSSPWYVLNAPAEDWTAQSGAGGISPRLLTSSASDTMGTLNPNSYTNFVLTRYTQFGGQTQRVSTRFNYPTPGSMKELDLVLSYQNTLNYYLCAITESTARACGTGPAAGSPRQISIWKVANGVCTQLATQACGAACVVATANTATFTRNSTSGSLTCGIGAIVAVANDNALPVAGSMGFGYTDHTASDTTLKITRATVTASAPVAANIPAACGLTSEEAYCPFNNGRSVYGVVYRDFNGNGVRNDGEVGIGGITVTAYSVDNIQLASTVSNFEGHYEFIDLVPAAGTVVRIEATNEPSYLTESSATLIFVTTPGCSPASNFAFFNPNEDFCSVGNTNPWVFTSCFAAGAQTEPGHASLASFQYNWGSNIITDPGMTNLVAMETPMPGMPIDLTETGPIWGLAWQRTTSQLFASAFQKRHVLYQGGDLGSKSAVIYRAKFLSPADVMAFEVTPYIDLGALVPGSVPATPLHDANWDDDFLSWGFVGKAGLGGLAISLDQSQLYVMNLYDRKLYVINIGNPSKATITAADVTSFPIPTTVSPACNPNDLRPFAVDTVDGIVYVGITCTAESSKDYGQLHGYIFTFNAGTWFQLADFPLNYPRPQASDPCTAAFSCTGCTNTSIETANNSAIWRPWSTTLFRYCLGYGAFANPQPLVSSIRKNEFGNLVVAVMDRFGHQSGNYRSGAGTEEGVVAGDVLCLALTNIGYVLESGGVCGPYQRANILHGNIPKITNGPGGSEMYWADAFNWDNGPHGEITVGAINILRGTLNVMATMMDPAAGRVPELGTFRTGGIGWFNDVNGGRDQSYIIYSTDDPLTFGKAAGLGDLEFGCAAAMVQIGDRVWYDVNRNGIQDPGEVGINDVCVSLYDASNNLLSTTITNAAGYYLFPNLNVSTTYQVQVSCTCISGAYMATLPLFDDGSSQAHERDSNAVSSPLALGCGWSTSVTTSSSGQNDYSLDFGFWRAACVGDTVFEDMNRNGVQDAIDTGVSGVTVELRDCNDTLISSAVTDVDGHYLFCNLTGGNYKINVLRPSGFTFTLPLQGGNALDSDVTPAVDGLSAASQCFVLPPGATNLTLDAGLYRPASLGNFVWLDLNANGQQDPSEPGVSATVVLQDCQGNVLGSTTTNSSGYYLFTDLVPGNYQVEFQVDSNQYTFTTGYTGDFQTDSDTTVITDGVARSSCVSLLSNTQNLTIDAGVVGYPSLGNLVWLDQNANGIQDVGEPGIVGITVELYNCQGVLITSTVTNDTGYYLFPRLTPGQYNVRFLQTGLSYFWSPVNQGNDTSLNSKAVPSSANSVDATAPCLTLAANEVNLNQDAGLFLPSAVGDFVWHDANYNGIQDAGEEGVPANMTLIDCDNGVPVSSIVSTDGVYNFRGLNAGNYTVIFVVDPTQWFFTKPFIGGDGSIDSNAIVSDDPSTAFAPCFNLPLGVENLTIDAGVLHFSSVGNLVWHDLNANGVQDSGEAGIPDVLVELRNCSGFVMATTTTNTTGFYLFDHLYPGDYQVSFSLPNANSNWVFSPFDQGSDDSVDSDARYVTRYDTSAVTECFSLGPEQFDPTRDAGVFALGAIGNLVWRDSNNNGIQDAGELGVPGIAVQLEDCNGTVLATTTTNSTGYYLFDRLLPTGYRVVFFIDPALYAFSPALQGSDPTVNSKAQVISSDAAATDCIPLQPEEINLVQDAGIYLLGSLGNRVWLDSNSNGIQEPNEAGVSNVFVQLLDCSSPAVVLRSTTTNATGYYLFRSLPQGCYQVSFNASKTQYTFTCPFRGNFSVDSNVPNFGETFGVTDQIALGPEENNMTIDAGLSPPVCTTNPLGINQFNAFVFGNFRMSSSDVGGRLAAGGNVALTSTGVGNELPQARTPCTSLSGWPYALVAGGSVSANNGELLGGYGVYGNSLSSSFGLGSRCSWIRNASLIDFAAVRQQALDLLQQNCALKPTGSGLRGTYAAIEVFNISASVLSSGASLSQLRPYTTIQSVIVNVWGKDVVISNRDFRTWAGYKNKLIFNFCNADTITFRNIGFYGTLFAPRSAIINSSGQLNGNLIAASFDSSFELHETPFQGCLYRDIVC